MYYSLEFPDTYVVEHTSTLFCSAFTAICFFALRWHGHADFCSKFLSIFQCAMRIFFKLLKILQDMRSISCLALQTAPLNCETAKKKKKSGHSNNSACYYGIVIIVPECVSGPWFLLFSPLSSKQYCFWLAEKQMQIATPACCMQSTCLEETPQRSIRCTC